MKKSIYVILLVLFLPGLIYSQVDTIFIWDNDRGEYWQTGPAVGMRNWGAYIAWVDSRWGDYDIFKQGIRSNGTYNGQNTMTSIDEFNQFSQNFPDLEANPANYAITVWEDSSYQPVYEQPAQIWARLHYGNAFMVYGNERSQKRPAVSCRINGDFIVSWTSYDENEPAILCRRYNNGGGFQDHYKIREHMQFKARIPISRAVYCDSGFFVVFEDTLDDGTQRSIFGQYRKVDGGLLIDFKKLSHEETADYDNEEYPDVAINENGNMVVVWQDYRNGNWDIYAQQFQAYRDGFDWSGPELRVTSSDAHQYRPKVALFENGNFVVVWFDNTGVGYDIWGKTCIQGSFREEFRVNQLTTNAQWFPDIAGRYSDTIFVAWQSRATSNWDKVYCRGFRYFLDSPGGVDSITNDIPVTPDTCYPGGRRCWYFDDENYDNPATPAWNEDPIDEPDSIYVDLDFAMVDQIMELNTNGQLFVVCEDTLPTREQDALLTAYDAVFLDLGYRTAMASAGVITAEEQNTLVDYIDPFSGDGKPAMVDGNDFGYMYDGTDFFKLFGAEYKGDGAPYTDGNIDTIFGIEGLFSENETLMYDYKGMVDNYIDSLDALPPAKLLLYSSGAPTEWMAGRAVFWGSYWKSRDPGSTIYNSFIPAGITSATHPHTYAEYYRRCLGFLGLNCQPEPITTLQAHIDTTATPEGRVVMKWQVVSDDSLRESAAGPYKLKFAREKMTSESAFDAAEEYYQTWNTGDSTVGDWVIESLYGLPPMDTLVFALKVSDESNLWNALGAEPQAIVGGDAVTPHNIVIGDNYVKDFSNAYEFLHVDTRGFYDSLFVTWDSDSFYLGFSRCNFQSAGDLLIYFDVRAGGPDSTYPYHGLSGRSYFSADDGIFFPDYCLIIENSSSSRFYEGTATDERLDTWVLRTFHGSYSEDNIVNGYLYTEISIPFTDIGYNTSNPFKLIVTVQNELSNEITNIYPIFNPIGSGAKITQYYYWSALGDDMIPNQTVQVIGIEEESEVLDIELTGKALLVTPNPFTSATKILFNVAERADIAEIKIFDITGRLVKRFEFKNLQTEVNQISWDGTDELGRKLPGGVYFCEFTGGDKTEIEKAIFIR